MGQGKLLFVAAESDGELETSSSLQAAAEKGRCGVGVA